MITKYLSLVTTLSLLYLIANDVNRFVVNGELIFYTLSHFSVHIALREIFHDQLSFVLYFVFDMIIMFGKSFYIYWALFNESYLENPNCQYYFVITALQSLVFSKFIFRRCLFSKVINNRFMRFIISIGDKLCQADFMITVLLFKQKSIYPDFDFEILTLTAIGAWIMQPVFIILMRDFGCSFREVYKILFPSFKMSGYIYFFSVLITYEWAKHLSFKTELLIFLGRYFPDLLTDKGIKIVVLLSFLLAETFFQLIWQKKQSKRMSIIKSEQKQKLKKQKKDKKKTKKEKKSGEKVDEGKQDKSEKAKVDKKEDKQESLKQSKKGGKDKKIN